MALSPRNVEYQFNLGQIYVVGKKWDLASEVFTRLKEGSDKQAAAAAKQQLADLATLQKYGIRPEHAGQTEAPAGAASTPGAGSALQPRLRLLRRKGRTTRTRTLLRNLLRRSRGVRDQCCF